MILPRTRRIVLLAIPVLAAGLFMLDWFTPVGVMDWVLYLIPLLLSFYAARRMVPYLLAAVFSALAVAGIHMSPQMQHGGMNLRLPDEFLSTGTLWVVAFMVAQHRRMVDETLKLSCAVEHSPASIVITDKAGNITYVNPKFTEETGYTVKEVLGQNPRLLKSGETPPEEYGRLWKTITSGGEWRGVFHNRKKNGELFWEAAVIGPVRDESGQITHYMAVKEDITGRKQAEAALRDREFWLNESQRAGGIGSYSLDIKSGSWTASETLEEIFGLPPGAEKTLATWNGLVHPDDREAMLDYFLNQVVNARQPFNQEYRIQRANDGAERWVLGHGRLLFDASGEPVTMIGTILDITGRKLAELAARESQALYQSLAEQLPIGIFRKDAAGRYIYVNHYFCQIKGMQPDDFLGKMPTEAGLCAAAEPRAQALADKYVPAGEDHHQQIMRTGQPIELEEEYMLPGGGKKILQIIKFPVRNAAGHIVGSQGVQFDITGRKKLEVQMLRLQRMEGIGTLASGIAHDLNNVLAPLMMAVELLREKVNDAEGRRLLGSLAVNVQRAADLVRQVLTFGRGTPGERVPVQLPHLAREIERIIQETFPKSIAFGCYIAPDLWTVTGDATQLHQVLLNLCINARDSMPQGGKLALELKNLVLDDHYSAMNLEAKPGPYVLIEVADTGTGIPPEIQDKIFDPFFTTKELGKGTGLGLSSALGIIQSHGGFIHLYSEAGKGSTFRVYLPAKATAAVVETAAVEQTQLPRGHHELVLVVDDEEPVRQVVQKILERFNYRVLLAANGAEALSLYAQHRAEIAVVVTDMMMPIMDGPATIVALLAMNAQVKIIGSSGLAANGGVAKASAIGVRHFIPKPYTAEAMLNTLHEAITGNSSERAKQPVLPGSRSSKA